MKNSFRLLFLLLGLCLFTISSCTDDDETTTTPNEETLNYDGNWVTAPALEQGTRIYAAYFPADEVQSLVGRRLARIDFWLQTIPDATTVRIYRTSGNDRSPGDQLHERNLTQRINTTGWYQYVIPAETVVEIPADGIWLAVETTAPTDRFQAIGCDDGSNFNPNGDRMLPPTGGTWTSFSEITSGGETINWNIRGVLAAQ
jgi:hypothetical protein